MAFTLTIVDAHCNPQPNALVWGRCPVLRHKSVAHGAVNTVVSHDSALSTTTCDRAASVCMCVTKYTPKGIEIAVDMFVCALS